ncbi:MAG: PAS domain S-box protein [Candidatus Moranbacteria bacterium]|nr:PAS domain S-box protein [Candidatus Moranbacteria bacterium]
MDKKFNKKSRYILKALSDASMEAIAFTKKGRIVLINKAAEQMFQVKLKDVRGKLGAIFFAKESRAEVKNRSVKNLSGKYEAIALRSDGKRFPVEIRVRKMPFYGDVVRSAVIRDVTEQKEMEAELRKFKKITDYGNYCAIITDLSGKILYINDFGAKIHGYKKSSLIGRSIDVLHIEDQIEKSREIYKNISDRERFSSKEVKHKKRNGDIVYLLMSGALIRDKENNPQFLATSSIDMTEIKKAQEKMLSSFMHVGRINRKVNILLDLVNHNLKRKKDIYSLILNSGLRVAEADFCNLYSYEKLKGHFNLLFSFSKNSKKIKFKEFFELKDKKLIRKIIVDKERVQGKKIDKDIKNFCSKIKLTYYLILPLKIRNNLIGVIFIGFKRVDCLTTQELKILELFASQSSQILSVL